MVVFTYRILLYCVFVFTPGLWAQQSALKAQSTLYQSQSDELLTIKKVSILPVMDNLGGIYSRPLESHLIEWVNNNHHWDHIPINSIGPVLSPNELEASNAQVKRYAQNTDTDALIAAKITKGPKGIYLKINLFLVEDGKLFSSEEIKNSKKFDIKQIKQLASQTMSRVFSKVPYNGLVLSRHNNKVTMNIGKKDGIENGKVVSVVQIIKLNRHPKFNFIINTEKEILGKVKILKVDNTLSFGVIVTEIERGAIKKNAKISGLDYINYGTDSLTLSKATESNLSHRLDQKISFGKNAQAWLPKKPPTFGKVSAKLGLGTFTSTLSQTTENLNSTNPIYPSIILNGELWLSSRYSIHAGLKQGIISSTNPKSGTSPSTLNMSLASYNFALGYNFRLGADVWGPKVELLGGFSTYKLFVDNVTDGLTTLSYSGLNLGILGSFPVSKKKDWSVAVGLNFFINPELTESPGTSGDSNKNSINQFSFQVNKRVGVNVQLTGSLDLEMYSTNFSGAGSRTQASSASQKHTTFTGGISYLF